jgi:hypothetical protein
MIYLFDYDMTTWHVSQNTHAKRGMLIFVHIIFDP